MFEDQENQSKLPTTQESWERFRQLVEESGIDNGVLLEEPFKVVVDALLKKVRKTRNDAVDCLSRDENGGDQEEKNREIIECQSWGKDEWREKIRQVYPQPEKWMSMRHAERLELRILGKNLVAIAKIFGIKEDSYNFSMQTKLAKEIYGEEHEVIQCQSWGKDEWKKKIREVCPDVEKWMSMGHAEKLDFRILGKSFTSLAKIFGIKGNSYGSEVQLRLARDIYGDDHEVIQCQSWGKDEWRKKIRQVCPEPEKWMSMRHAEKLQFRVLGKTFVAIAKIFGIKGSSYNSSVQKALAREIYGIN